MSGKLPTVGRDPDAEAPESTEIPKQHQCVSCGAKSPLTETNYTLISPRHGWRLTRGTDAGGKKTAEWRCPTCWASYRKKATG
jgi:hypothetical protein